MIATTDKADAGCLPILTGLEVEVVAFKRMPFGTVGFDGVPGGEGFAPKNVCLSRDNFKVSGIDTMAHTAQVVELQESDRSMPYQQLIGDTMGINNTARNNMKVSITRACDGSLPEPAGLLWPNIYQGPESSGNQRSKRWEWDSLHVTIVPRMVLGVN